MHDGHDDVNDIASTQTHTHDAEPDHEHSHEHEHAHEHSHSHSDIAKGSDQQVEKLLAYLLEHNIQHTNELLALAAKIAEQGFAEVADQITTSVEQYRQGNAALSDALRLAQEKGI